MQLYLKFDVKETTERNEIITVLQFARTTGLETT